jgi:hypothetical protein
MNLAFCYFSTYTGASARDERPLESTHREDEFASAANREIDYLFNNLELASDWL